MEATYDCTDSGIIVRDSERRSPFGHLCQIKSVQKVSWSAGSISAGVENQSLTVIELLNIEWQPLLQPGVGGCITQLPEKVLSAMKKSWSYFYCSMEVLRPSSPKLFHYCINSALSPGNIRSQRCQKTESHQAFIKKSSGEQARLSESLYRYRWCWLLNIPL